MSIQASHELKNLETRLQTALGQCKALRADRAARVEALDMQIAAAQSEIDRLQKSITKLKAATVAPIVSEHALLRYFERVKGIDLEEARNALLTPTMLEYIEKFGSGTFPNNSEPRYKLVVKNKTVVSLISNEQKEAE